MPEVKGLKNFVCFWRIFVVANIRNIKKQLEGTKFKHLLLADFRYSWVRYSGVLLYFNQLSVLTPLYSFISFSFCPSHTQPTLLDLLSVSSTDSPQFAQLSASSFVLSLLFVLCSTHRTATTNVHQFLRA